MVRKSLVLGLQTVRGVAMMAAGLTHPDMCAAMCCIRKASLDRIQTIGQYICITSLVAALLHGDVFCRCLPGIGSSLANHAEVERPPHIFFHLHHFV